MIRRYKQPDKKNAISLLKASREEIKFTLELEINQRSGSTIIRNIYESFRMLGDSLITAKGGESLNHIDAVKEIEKLKVDVSRSLRLLDNLRKLRHNINYYGYNHQLMMF